MSVAEPALVVDFSEAKLSSSGRISSRAVQLPTGTLIHVRFEVGARWSEDIGIDQSRSVCDVPHTGMVLAGTLGFRMADGGDQYVETGQAMHLPAGHDAWAVGDQACVSVEFITGPVPGPGLPGP